MKLKLVILTLVTICMFTDGKQLPSDTDGTQGYISSDVYNQSKTHVIPDSKQVESYRYENNCPNNDTIAPCVCIRYSHANDMALDCSAIESEEQLKQIFNSDFPVKKFSQFIIQYNNNLKVLESSVFNGVSFEMIYIPDNKIEVIEMRALDSCYDTAYDITLTGNMIISFPFDELTKFTKLKSLLLGDNPLSMIPADAINGLTTLEELYIDGITTNIVGTFENLPNLIEIWIGRNELINVPTKFINTGSSSLEAIDLNDNNIVSVEPGAFDIVEGLMIGMESNSLSTLDEVTWRTLLEAGGWLRAQNNPLVCGCDIAWMFKEDHLVDQIHHSTTCADGENIHDLDPSIFDNC